MRATGRSAEQPPPAANANALNQPKPHLSNRTLRRCCVTSNSG